MKNHQDRCEHGNDLYDACDDCGRFEDGSDGTTAGEYRAIRKRWARMLAGEECEHQRAWPNDEERK